MQATLLLLIISSLSNGKVNCDQQLEAANSTSNENASKPREQTPEGAGSSSTEASKFNVTSGPTFAEASTGRQAPEDYRQQPNPASADSSTKLSYDMQHELAATPPSATEIGAPQALGAGTNSAPAELSLATTAAAAASPTTTPASTSAEAASSTAGGQAAAQTERQAAPAGNFANGTQGRGAEQGGATDAGDSYTSTDAIATGEALVAGAHPPAEYLVSVDTLAASSSSPPGSAAAALDEASLDLDAALTSTSSSVVSRHGRASAGGAYTPPSASRLSAYAPLLLQNSRGAQPATSKPSPPPFDPIIVCYLGSWSVYRPSLAKFTPENINPFLCTHIIYAFAGLSSKYELKPFDSYNDITQGGYRKFTSLKEHNKQLKTLIAVGGWNEGSAR